MAIPIDAVTVWSGCSKFSMQESSDSRTGYGLSIAGHVIIALLLMFGILERIDLFPVAAAPSSAVSAPSDQNHPSGLPAVADVDKRAKAPPAALNVNGVDRPKQPGYDGTDPSLDQAGIAVPPAPEGDVASGGTSAVSRAMVFAPVGPAPPQITTREPGDDELTAIKEQKILCGVMAKRPMPAAVTRGQARVKGFATAAQAVAMMRSNQTLLDRHINADYIGNQRLFVESLDGVKKFAVLLPSGLTVNVGDLIEYDHVHIDPSNSCQFIPNLAVRKL